jgi:hypothetical protein
LTETKGSYIHGGDGAHFPGCENVHWDCKIAALEKRVKELEAERQWVPASKNEPGARGLYWVYARESNNPLSPFSVREAYWQKNLGWWENDERGETLYATHYMKFIKPEPPK